MKSYLVIISLILSSPSFAQSQHSITSRGSAPTTAEGVDLDNLTDNQKKIKDNYVHQGLTNRKYEELCAGNEDACNGEAAHVFGETGDKLVSLASKAYTMIMAGMDSKVTMGPKMLEGDKAITSNDSEREVNDYCKYIAVAGETVGTVLQTTAQRNAEEAAPANGTSSQKNLLYQAARSHEARVDSAKVETYAWGGTAACYTGMIAYSGFQFGGGSALDTGKSVGIKLAAATFLTGFYAKLGNNHQKYADKVLEIADQLPGAGECNPISDLQCYCAQPETKYDPQYCAKGMHKQEIETGDVRVTCLDSNMQSDPECTCLKNNSCGSKKFVADLSSIGLGSNFVAQAGKPMKQLTEGRLLAADLGQAAVNGNAAMANKQKLSELSKNVPPIALNSEQQKDAELLEKEFGIPKNLGSRIVAFNPGQSALDKARAAILSTGGNIVAEKNQIIDKKPGNVLYFGGQGKHKVTAKKSAKFDPFAAFNKKNQPKKAAGEVLHFGDRAQRDAEISKAGGATIFEILSRRYIVSGMKRLNGEEE